jgi:hypothetical protein
VDAEARVLQSGDASTPAAAAAAAAAARADRAGEDHRRADHVGAAGEPGRVEHPRPARAHEGRAAGAWAAPEEEGELVDAL